MSGTLKAVAAVVLALSAADVPVAQSPNDALREEAGRYGGDPRIIRALIARGADPNAAAADGRTPLVAAVEVVGAENLSAMRALLAAGADANRRAGLTTALCEAVSHPSAPPINKDDMVVLLLRHGADPNLRCRLGDPPLDGAILRHADELVGMLIAAGARVNDIDTDGRPMIIKAAIYGPLSIVRRVLDAGADVNARGRRGETALASAKNPHIAKLLRERGARE